MDAHDINRIPEPAARTDNAIIERACAVMTNATRLEFKFEVDLPDQGGAAVFVMRKGRQVARYRVQVRDTLTAAAAKAEMLGPGGRKRKLLFVATRIPKDTAEELRAGGVQFIDTAGNAYLDAAGLFVFIAGGAAPRADNKAPRLKPRVLGPAGLKVLFALLCDAAPIIGTYREIEKRAGVALGTVHKVIDDLKNLGYLVALPDGGHRLRDREKLNLQWADYYPLQLRPKLDPRRFLTTDNDWWRNTDIARYGACWGGETAAALLTDYLRPEVATVYAAAIPAQLIAERRMRPDPRGNIEFLQRFWHFDDPEHPAVVPPLLAYADLIFTRDGRNIEAAAHLRERYLARPIDKD